MLKNKKFEGYILRNRIVGVVVSLILVSVMIYMACHFSLIDRMNTRTYRTLADIENIDNLGENDVSITIERADYLTIVSRMADTRYCCLQAVMK